MAPPHRICLRGPWEWTAPGDAARRPIQLPRDRLLKPGTAPIHVRFFRRFHWPRPLPRAESLWLVVEDAAERVEVTLNQELLGTGRGGIQFDITRRVRQRNLLEISTLVSPDAPPWREVALEVRQAAADSRS